MLIACAMVGVSPAALADDAEALIRQGIELRRAGRDAEALEQFRRANQIAPSPRAAAQIGLAEQALGRWLDADGHLRAALAAASDPWIVKNRGTLGTAVIAVGQHLGLLEVLGDPAGASVRVDGLLAGTLPLAQPLRVNLGSVVLEVSADGHIPLTRTLNIASDRLTRESVSLRPLGGARLGGEVSGPGSGGVATSPPGADSHPALTVEGGASGGGDTGTPAPRAWQRRAAWISVWTGAGLVVVSGASFLVNRIELGEYNDNHCATIPQPACDDRKNAGELAQTIGVVTLIGAGAAAIAAGALFLTMPPTRGGQDTKTAFACAPSLLSPGILCAAHF
ncbi:MAG TPA: hypothetical protein VHU40_16155 [Polyangia bacterium]|nr:hypothetical protein [Polyangia bacterium]